MMMSPVDAGKQGPSLVAGAPPHPVSDTACPDLPMTIASPQADISDPPVTDDHLAA